MSWIERLNNITFEITTGEGSVFTPLWKDAVKNLRYNTEGFDFSNVEGTYVSRKTKSGNQYPLLFYFQGEGCVDEAKRFETASKDRRSWTIKHPFFDTIVVQPLSFKFDYTSYNTVRITGTVWETISRKYPKAQKVPSAEVESLKTSIDDLTKVIYTSSIIPVSTSNIQPAQDGVTLSDVKYRSLTQLSSEAADLKNRVNLASGAAQSIISDATGYITQTVNLINFPFDTQAIIDTKISIMTEAIRGLVDIFLNENEKDREIYEYQSSLYLSSLALNMATSEYDTIVQVLNNIDSLSEIYDEVLSNMDDINYVQNAELANELDLIINTAISGLFDIAFDSKQERRVLIDKDSNAVNLAHKYYGPGDDNLNEFINRNLLSKSEYISISKGREIIYFV